MPDVRPIDANALMKRICGHECGMHPEDCDGMESETVPCNFHAYVSESPTIDAQPVKRGKWIDSGVGGTVRCSNCKFTDFFAKRDRVMLFDFCPGCGSRMIDSAEEVVEYEAQWILRSDKPDEYNNMKYECSRCGAGETFNINIDVPFCWKCGARMKKIHG